MLGQLNRRFHEKAHWWFSGLLIALTLAFYAPAIHFGLVWDDPRFYQAAAAISPWWKAFLVPSMGTQQYYRPLAVIYSQWFMAPSGVVNSPLAHLVHIGIHLVIVLALFPLLRAFRFSVAHARLTALCFALFPPAYFAVAWHATQQPVMLLMVILALIAAQKYTRRRQFRFLLLSAIAYAMALLTMEAAVPFIAVFFWLAWDTRSSPSTSRPGQSLRAGFRAWISAGAWVCLHVALTGLFLLVWLSLPLHRAVTGTGFMLPVLAYLTQGMVYPLAQAGAGVLASWPAGWLIIAFFAAWAILTLGIWKWQSPRIAIWANLWAAAGLGPSWAGLSWDYAQYGARLFYPAAIGIAMVWGGWMSLVVKRQRWPQLVGIAICAGVIGTSLWQMRQFQQAYQISTDHLAHAVEVLSSKATPPEKLLFVNFPDRLEIRPRAYPVGYWGLVLAPVIQDLSDYAVAMTGRSAVDSSRSAFVVGTGARGTWPYRVDMRGNDTPPAAFFDAARSVDAVYLTDYLPDGSLRLSQVGSIQASSGTRPPMARLGDKVQLMKADILPTGGLRLTWRCLQPPGADDTIFVHLWQGDEFVAGSDGDSLGGLVPLPSWQAGTDILDIRTIDYAPLGPGTYEVRVGLYNRVTGTRYPAFAADGTDLGNGEVPVGSYTR